MQWTADHNQGYSPMDFVGGFHLPQTVPDLVCPNPAEPMPEILYWRTLSVLSPFHPMFTELWLRICFGFGRQQQFIAPPMSNVQFVPTPFNDHWHSYATLLSFSCRDSSFSRYFSECAQFESFPSSRSELGIGQVLLRRGSSQHRYTTHIRTFISQTIVEVRTPAGSGAGPIMIVCYLPSPRHLIPNRTLL